MLRFLTSGESHGQMLVSILDGMPAGLELNIDRINEELGRRQQGYGRGGRQKIETDTVEFAGGVRHGVTTGAPLSIIVRNRDWDNWRHVMSVSRIDLADETVRSQLEKKKITRFRPGHADLAGVLKFRQRDIRDVLERASARETAARVAVGAVCAELLRSLNVRLVSHVVQVGNIHSQLDVSELAVEQLDERVRASEMFCADPLATEKMKEHVRAAWQEGDSLGGVVEVVVEGLPVGLGSYTQWDEKIDGQIAQAVMSVQAIKAVSIGDGMEAAGRPGSDVHDALYPSAKGEGELPFVRKTNRAGGIEGGMTNGERLVVHAFMKPIPTLRKGLPSLSFPQYEAETAHYERSDVCAVPAASIVVKAMVSFVLARAMLNKFGSDTTYDTAQSLAKFREFCKDPRSNAACTLADGAQPTPEMELE